METDIESYLASDAALAQTESAQGRVLHPGETFEGFSVVAFLGRGGASEVWRVCDENLNADFAMKIFAPREGSTEKEIARLRRRFIAEARCLAQFTHPGIVRIHKFRSEGEHPFYTMDLLHPIVRPLQRRKARKIIVDILAALDAIHAKGVVHRDIKPANVLLDDYGNALLADFGIVQVDDAETAAKIAASGTTTTTSAVSARIAGTPDFSAPEQFIGEDATPASDLHAVGRLALWLFDGRPPLSWSWFVMRATNSSPLLRYKSAKAMKHALTTARIIGTATYITAISAATAAILIGVWAAMYQKPLPICADDISLEWYTFDYDFLRVPLKWPIKVINLKDGNTYRNKKQFGGGLNGGRGIFYRDRVKIRGNGTLYWPEIRYTQIHLMPGVKLVTSGRYPRATPQFPPPEANVTNMLKYASYIVEPGAELVFTDNPNYPASLIERR